MDNKGFSLAKHRMDKARSCLDASKIMLENGLYSDSANRSYYAIFHSVRALMALDREDRKKHSGVIAYFQEHYVKTGLIDKKYSRIIQDAFEIRQSSDYEDFYLVSRDDVEEQLISAEEFCGTVKEYIDRIMAER